ncbi:hypothetical protein NQD34_014563 [Periophthalmus magnuspinnatus]|nr:hypothetical protein NQD34_014563 [Periophthalmus magnuspinnatus]
MMSEDGDGDLCGLPEPRDSEGRSSLPPRTFIRLNDLSGVGIGSGGGGDGSGGGGGSGCGGAEVIVEPPPPSPALDGISTAGDEGSGSGGETLPYPTLAPVVFFYLKQNTRPRSWCLKMVCNPYPFF